MISKQKILKRRETRKRGGVLLMVLVFMIVFIVVMTYALRLVIRQSHETINQEQEEQAFWVADSGVQYVNWLLNPNGGNIAPAAVPVIIDHSVTDDLGQQIGSFSIVDVVVGTGLLQFRSIGKDVVLTNKCQSIAVELRQIKAGDSYIITEWNHQVGYPCS